MSPDGSVHGWRDEAPAVEQPSAIMAGVTGAELRKLRERAGLTQADLAARAEVSKRQVIRWEMEDSPISKLVALGLKALLTK